MFALAAQPGKRRICFELHLHRLTKIVDGAWWGSRVVHGGLCVGFLTIGELSMRD